MLKEKIEDEINAIESEFAGTAESDDTRTFMLLINECTKRDHIFKAFPFGNKKSLNIQLNGLKLQSGHFGI